MGVEVRLDPAARATAVTDLFGKNAQALTPLLMDGRKGIEEFGAEAVKLGVAMNDVDAAKVLQAHEATERIGLAVQGLENRFVVGLAPVLEMVADKVMSIVPPADEMGQAILTGMRGASEGVGVLLEAWHVLQLGTEVLVWTAVSGWEAIVHGLGYAAQAVDSFVGLFGVDLGSAKLFGSVEAGLDGLRVGLQSTMADTAAQVAHPDLAGWGKAFDGIQQHAEDTARALADKKRSMGGAISGDLDEASKKVTDALAKMQRDVDQFGMSKGQKAAADIADMGGSKADQDKANALAGQLDALNGQKKVLDDITKLQVTAAQAGMTAAQKQVDDLRRAGATDAQVGQAAALQRQIDAAKALADDTKAAAKIVEDGMGDAAKFDAEASKIQRLVSEGLLSVEQGKKALDAEASKADHDPDDKTKLEQTRRFDFRVPAQPQHEDATKKALDIAKANLESVKKTEYYQEQQYNFALADQGTADQVVDL